MTAFANITGFSIGPFDRIFLHDVEVKLALDAPDGKAFERREGNGKFEVLSNEDIQRALAEDHLIVDRGFYDPRKRDLDKGAAHLQDMPPEEQDSIGFKLLWVTLLRRKRDEIGRIPHHRRKPLMRQIREEYYADHEEMRGLAHFKKFKFSYENSDEPHLKLASYEAVSEWSLKLERAGGDARVLRDRRGTGKKSTFTPEELHLQGHFVWRYLSSTEPTGAYLFRIMKAVERRLNRSRADDDQLNLGSRSTFYNRLDAIPDFSKTVARLGEAKAMAKYNVVIGKDRGHPMDMAEGDECRLDLVTMIKAANVWDQLSEEEQKAFKDASERFWFSAVTDHSSTVFLSFRVHTQAPSIATARATFEMTARDKTQTARNAGCKSEWKHCGGMRGIRLDAAAWYTSTAVLTTLTDAKTAKFHTPVKMPWLRGTMEQIFGTIGSLTLQNFSGRTFSDVVKRGDHDPKKGVSVDPVMLEKVLLRAIVDIFHNTPNTGKLGGMTPNQAWLVGCKLRNPPAPPTGYLRRKIYGINLTRVIRREGIRFIGFYFRSEEIQRMRMDDTDREVHIRVDMQDVSEITVFDGELAYRVPCRLPQLKGLSYWEATALLQELRLIDTEYTNRTSEQVDAALEYIDAQAEIGRIKYSVASPIITEEHIKRVERRVLRGIRVVPESEYSHEVSTQDWAGTPFSDDAWGYTDELAGDDLDLGKEQTAAAAAAKYGESTQGKRKPKKAQAQATGANPEALGPAKPAETSGTVNSVRYFDEH
ncbi:Mu transposase C-terminal domain-containing protein [Rhizobium beringeri]|uniref:Mu transposase C-terminal domain-containing protein n=1 Tax=Rhizobium beringeri TaxID=3019934 RepID=UPI002E1359E3|nr:Mu transposase C-terminal domain-containing protein [Rhizobium beringeri]